MRADRGRGLTFKQIAEFHGVSVGFAHLAARDVQVAYIWRKWHLSRWRKPEPPPPPVELVWLFARHSQPPTTETPR